MAGKCACKRARLCGVRTGQSDAHAVLQQAAGSSDITCGALDQCLVLPEEADDLASMRLKFVTVYCTVQRHDPSNATGYTGSSTCGAVHKHTFLNEWRVKRPIG